MSNNFSLNKGLTLWFTGLIIHFLNYKNIGLSGSGKSTIATNFKNLLLNYNKNINQTQIQILDGDVMRTGLNKDLTFSKNDRIENIRRIAQVAKFLAENGAIVIVSLISPFQQVF